jgi:hypothetical protein
MGPALALVKEVDGPTPLTPLPKGKGEPAVPGRAEPALRFLYGQGAEEQEAPVAGLTGSPLPL